jgi:hypothetical protein
MNDCCSGLAGPALDPLPALVNGSFEAAEFEALQWAETLERNSD